MSRTAGVHLISRSIGYFAIHEWMIEYWQSITAIAAMIIFMAITWKVFSDEGIDESDEENGTCPLEDYDLKKCPKCGGDSLRVSGNGAVKCEECGFSKKDAKLF